MKKYFYAFITHDMKSNSGIIDCDDGFTPSEVLKRLNDKLTEENGKTVAIIAFNNVT